jgi:uncharacterized protein involved in exopolysaccharide biosynthesis
MRRPLHVAVPALLAALVGLGCALVLPPRYRATTVVGARWESPRGGAPRPQGEAEASRLQAVRQRVLERSAIEDVLRNTDPYGAGSGQTAASKQAETLFAAVTVRALGTDTFTIEYVHGDPATASRVANRLAVRLVSEAEKERARRAAQDPARLEVRLAVARRAVEDKEAAFRRLQENPSGASGDGADPASAQVRRRGDLERLAQEYAEARQAFLALQEEWRVAETASRVGRGPAVQFEVLQPAPVPARPFFPIRMLFAIAGLAVGLTAGLAAAMVAESRDHSVKDPEDLRKTLPQPLLAIIPEVRPRRRRA